MKIFNYYIRTIAIFAASYLLLTGCNKLEQNPENRFTDKNFWSPERAMYIVNTAYSQMYNAEKMWTDEALSDNVIDGRKVTDQRLIRTGQAISTIGVFDYEWRELYSSIKTCHIFLKNVDNIKSIDEAVKKRMIAEIRFIRAYEYFRLTNFYGDILFFTKDITLDEAKTMSRTPAAEVMAFIHNELDEIMMELPSRDEMPKEENGRITRGAVAMLQARAYLMESDWKNVEKYCDCLINHSDKYGTYSLFPSYAGLFEEENEYNQEVILCRAQVKNMMTWDEMLDMAPLSLGGRAPDRVPQQNLVDNYLTLGGFTINENGTDYKTDAPYDNRDPRMTATVIYDGYKWSDNFNDGSSDVLIDFQNGTDATTGQGSNGCATGYAVRKYYAPQAAGDLSSGLNIIMMRYADVLLMYAEAKLEQGMLNEDIWNKTIREIRSRAGFTVDKALNFPANKTKDELRQIVRNERRSELALEGLRWYDIKRWKAGSEYLNEPVRGASFIKNLSIKMSFDENRDYLWAVPQSQIDLNNNLLPQNPGY